ncbi:MAG: HD domain-containing protein [Candidatus Hydrogenedentes bacterium]|nr:HD domain-containing protein [Candidatus Hydrogenedentota bacterium]
MNADAARIDAFDLVCALSRIADLMNPAVSEHQSRVAVIALALSLEMQRPEEETTEIGLAGLIHDIGAFSLQERLDLLSFELQEPDFHARVGYLLLHTFSPFAGIAAMIRYHHTPWRNGEGAAQAGHPIPLAAHILHLADRVEVAIDRNRYILGQTDQVCERIRTGANTSFHPDVLAAFLRLAGREYFWLDVVSHNIGLFLRKSLRKHAITMTMQELSEFAALLCLLVDFKSSFTATHSSGVAATALALARRAGFSSRDQEMMRVAAYLHDVGKLGIPSEIIEKKGPLTGEEQNIMRSHAYFTHEILGSVEGLEEITDWGALHQERLDGSGYPFHKTAEQLSDGARLMAVADIFTALTEDRPYRAGMSKEDTLRALNRLSAHRQLESKYTDILTRDFDDINAARAKAQAEAAVHYADFLRALTQA